jgi:hypothetical protein
MRCRRVLANGLLLLVALSSLAEAQYVGGPASAGLPRSAEADFMGNSSAAANPSDPADAASDLFGGYRTLCVRLCDGFYFPISFSTSLSALSRDAAQCSASCGEAGRLFYHPNPGGSVESMTDLTGRAYISLPTAFSYRKRLLAGCSCRPQAALTPAVASDGNAALTGPAADLSAGEARRGLRSDWERSLESAVDRLDALRLSAGAREQVLSRQPLLGQEAER